MLPQLPRQQLIRRAELQNLPAFLRTKAVQPQVTQHIAFQLSFSALRPVKWQPAILRDKNTVFLHNPFPYAPMGIFSLQLLYLFLLLRGEGPPLKPVAYPACQRLLFLISGIHARKPLFFLHKCYIPLIQLLCQNRIIGSLPADPLIFLHLLPAKALPLQTPLNFPIQPRLLRRASLLSRKHAVPLKKSQHILINLPERPFLLQQPVLPAYRRKPFKLFLAETLLPHGRRKPVLQMILFPAMRRVSVFMEISDILFQQHHIPKGFFGAAPCLMHELLRHFRPVISSQHAVQKQKQAEQELLQIFKTVISRRRKLIQPFPRQKLRAASLPDTDESMLRF